MNKIAKKFLTVALTSAMAVSCLAPVAVVNASSRHNIQSEPDWTKESAVWQVTDTVTAQVRNGVLYIDGEGAIPNYTAETYSERPWNTSLFGSVVVGSGITDIGTRAFAKFDYLYYFTIPTTCYVADSSVFMEIDSDPTVRLVGSEETTRMIGDKIAYTSLDSWAKLAQSHVHNIEYVMDNGTMKNLLKTKTTPNITYVFSADNKYVDNKSRIYEEESEKTDTDVHSPLRFAPGYEITGRAVTSKQVIQGTDYLELIANYLNTDYQGYVYGQSYRNDVTSGDKYYEQFEDTKNYSFTIPDKWKSAGRTFKVILVKDGQPTVLDDLDNSDDTITFATNLGSFNYSVIYSE